MYLQITYFMYCWRLKKPSFIHHFQIVIQIFSNSDTEIHAQGLTWTEEWFLNGPFKRDVSIVTVPFIIGYSGQAGNIQGGIWIFRLILQVPWELSGFSRSHAFLSLRHSLRFKRFKVAQHLCYLEGRQGRSYVWGMLGPFWLCLLASFIIQTR